MPDYRYVAIDPQGRERKGRLTAANDDACKPAGNNADCDPDQNCFYIHD